MKKWVTCCVAVGSVVAVGIVVRQVLVDLSDNADLWTSRRKLEGTPLGLWRNW